MRDLFFHPPAAPFNPGDISGAFFILPSEIPSYSELGAYDPVLLLLSYVIAAVSAYVALDIAGKIGILKERSQTIKLICGSFAIGAGVWAMHFVGMLAYQMRMEYSFDPLITALSMIVAIVFAGIAFIIISRKNLKFRTLLLAAPLMGLAICSMHYIGMSAMKMDGVILYTPGLFFLSFIIAVIASAAALQLMFQSRQSTNPVFFRIIAALVMGIAVTGMHYTGMAASVMIPFAECRYNPNQDHAGLATSIAMISFLVIAVAYLVRELDDAVSQVQQRTAQLFQSQKMEAVGQLTGGIAHDFNNILAVVLGNLELLERQPSLTPAGQDYIKAAQTSIMKARNLTQRLLGFSRKQVLHPELVNINEELPAMLHFIERAVSANIFIRTNIMPNLPIINVDPLQLEGALLNLVLNARDALNENGEILVLSDIAEVDAQMAQGLEIKPGAYVTIRVKDKGHGMTPEVLSRATEPFFTTKAVGKGSGMGLSMVYGFVKQSNGALVIDSEHGLGTTVSLYLPVSDVNINTPVKPRHEERTDVVTGRGTILVVDDQPEVRIYLEAALSEIGYIARIAESGEQALQLFKEQKPDLVITDVMMPGMNGYELAEKLIALAPDTHIIFMSGYTSGNTIPAGIIPENTTFLQKPFTLGKLAQSIRLMMDQKKN